MGHVGQKLGLDLGQPFSVLPSLPEFGDIDMRTDGAFRHAVKVIFNHLAPAQNPAIIAQAATHAKFQRIMPKIQQTFFGHTDNRHICGMDQIQPGVEVLW